MKQKPIVLDQIDKQIINHLQDGFPLCPAPFAKAGQSLNLSEKELIERMASLQQRGVITRFGPFIDAQAMGGAFCLCAMAVPENKFEYVAEQVNNYLEVAHNYQRDHQFNMWFVLATETSREIAETIAKIEKETGFDVFSFPKQEEYFIGFRGVA